MPTACLLTLTALLLTVRAQSLQSDQCYVKYCFGHRELNKTGNCGCYNQGGPLWAMAVGFIIICLLLDVALWRSLKRRKLIEFVPENYLASDPETEKAQQLANAALADIQTSYLDDDASPRIINVRPYTNAAAGPPLPPRGGNLNALPLSPPTQSYMLSSPLPFSPPPVAPTPFIQPAAPVAPPSGPAPSAPPFSHIQPILRSAPSGSARPAAPQAVRLSINLDAGGSDYLEPVVSRPAANPGPSLPNRPTSMSSSASLMSSPPSFGEPYIGRLDESDTDAAIMTSQSQGNFQSRPLSEIHDQDEAGYLSLRQIQPQPVVANAEDTYLTLESVPSVNVSVLPTYDPPMLSIATTQFPITVVDDYDPPEFDNSAVNY